MSWEDISRSTSPATRAARRTPSCRRTRGYTSCSARPATRAAPWPASKPASRLSQARGHSSVPRLTSFANQHCSWQSVLGNGTGQVCHPSGFTVVLKRGCKNHKKFWLLIDWSVKSLQDADPQAVHIHLLIEYILPTVRRAWWERRCFLIRSDFCKRWDELKIL